MQRFELVLKNEKVNLYNRLGWLIIAINMLVFIYLALVSPEKQIRIPSIATSLVVAVCFLLQLYFRNTPYRFGLRPFFLILMAGWLSLEYYWIAAITVVFDMLHAATTRRLTATFSANEIVYPAFPAKRIQWTELSNALLKDGLLTLDFKNNKLIQQAVEENNVVRDEQEFNDFCRAQLNK